MVQAVVVLMTPDDEARLREAYQGRDERAEETELTPQPRPNVLIEAGMALGLFPERTVIVELGRLRPASDIGGRHVIRMANSIEKRQELAQRLQTAKCTVNLTGTDWHTAGDFDSCLPLSPPRTDDTGGERLGFLEYFDGLSSDEIYRLAIAVIENTQTVSCGRNDSVAASLSSKGLLERVPFEPTLRNMQLPYTIPLEVWRYLQANKEAIVDRAIQANPNREDRLSKLSWQ